METTFSVRESGRLISDMLDVKSKVKKLKVKV